MKMNLKRTLSAFLCLLTVLPLFSSCGENEKTYTLADDDLNKYFTETRDDYVGLTIPVSASYEVTDSDVEDYINAVLDEHRYAIPGKQIADGDIVGLYMRIEYEGKPFPVTGFSNYSASEPTYTVISEDSNMLPGIRDALLGKTADAYKLHTDFGGSVRAGDTIVFTYYAYYVEDGKQNNVDYNARVFYDLTTVTAEENPLVYSAVGQPVGEIYAYEEEKEVGGVLRTVQYNCLVNCKVDEEVAVTVEDVILPEDAFASDGEYAYLNGASVTVTVVPTGIYQLAVLDANFLEFELEFYAEDGRDPVEAYRDAVRDILEQQMASSGLYTDVFEYIFEKIRPATYPTELNLETVIPTAVDNIISSEDYADAAAYYGMDVEAFIRSEFGIDTGEYAEMSLRDALFRYTYNTYDREMLIGWIAQNEGLYPTDEEYKAYLQSYVDQLIAAGQTSYTLESLEAYYDSNYGTGYLREYLTYNRVVDFLFKNNRYSYTLTEDAD